MAGIVVAALVAGCSVGGEDSGAATPAAVVQDGALPTGPVLGPAGFQGFKLGMTAEQARAAHPDLRRVAAEGAATVVHDGTELTFLDGTLVEVAPPDGTPTADGLAVGGTLAQAWELYGPAPVGPRHTVVFPLAEPPGGGYRVAFAPSVGSTDQAPRGRVTRLSLCLCATADAAAGRRAAVSDWGADAVEPASSTWVVPVRPFAAGGGALPLVDGVGDIACPRRAVASSRSDAFACEGPGGRFTECFADPADLRQVACFDFRSPSRRLVRFTLAAPAAAPVSGILRPEDGNVFALDLEGGAVCVKDLRPDKVSADGLLGRYGTCRSGGVSTGLWLAEGPVGGDRAAARTQDGFWIVSTGRDMPEGQARVATAYR